MDVQLLFCGGCCFQDLLKNGTLLSCVVPIKLFSLCVVIFTFFKIYIRNLRDNSVGHSINNNNDIYIYIYIYIKWQIGKRKRKPTELQYNKYWKSAQYICRAEWVTNLLPGFPRLGFSGKLYIYIYIFEICIFRQLFFVNANFIKHNRHFMSTYFLLDPFEFPYYFYRIWGELI